MRSDTSRLKDDVLLEIAQHHNVAQFFSTDTSLIQRHSCIRNFDLDHKFPDLKAATQALLVNSRAGTVNVRTFHPSRSKGLPFHYGLDNIDSVLSTIESEVRNGLNVIVNETIDVHDGGVSGVSHGGIVEFSPDDTPRCVDRPGVARLPFDVAINMFRTVYGINIENLEIGTNTRTEFSIHPLRQGYRYDHLIYWELEATNRVSFEKDIRWPNNFSRKIGDKAFGLLVASLLHLPVPNTTVVSRSIAPFTFGSDTGESETWLRTCPYDQTPGEFTTTRGWIDPFKLLEVEDLNGDKIASVLSQRGVAAKFSGALYPTTKGRNTIEGRRGFGDDFMLGLAKPEVLPTQIEADVDSLAKRASAGLGAPVSLEWAHDGKRAWILQMHRVDGKAKRRGVIFPGNRPSWRQFEASEGLDALKELLQVVKPSEEGVLVIGDVGVTSHFGDLLRKARVPSRIISVKPDLQESLFQE